MTSDVSVGRLGAARVAPGAASGRGPAARVDFAADQPLADFHRTGVNEIPADLRNPALLDQAAVGFGVEGFRVHPHRARL
jgi:hypothetical protein